MCCVDSFLRVRVATVADIGGDRGRQTLDVHHPARHATLAAAAGDGDGLVARDRGRGIR